MRQIRIRHVRNVSVDEWVAEQAEVASKEPFLLALRTERPRQSGDYVEHKGGSKRLTVLL